MKKTEKRKEVKKWLFNSINKKFLHPLFIKRMEKEKTKQNKKGDKKMKKENANTKVVDRESLIKKTMRHTVKKVHIKVISIMKNSETGLRIKYSDGSMGTASINLLRRVN